MKNSIGTSVILTLFGESHGSAVGAVLDGMAPGVEVDEKFISDQLGRRRPCGPTDTARVEKDDWQIISGVYQGRTTGTPIAIVIPNENVRSEDYDKFAGIARPSHADFTAEMKYHGFQDPRGGGHFSGRVTAGIVAAGSVCLKALEHKGIRLATHILDCDGVADASFDDFSGNSALETAIDKVNSGRYPVINDIWEAVSEKILDAKNNQDSIGGVIQTAIAGMPAGVGEPWFDSLEGVISRAVFASGGINGGISNGMPVIFNMAVKPTPSISRKQQSVDFVNGKDVDLELRGRHDPAIIRRICIVVTSLVAVVLCDVLAQRFGTDYLGQQTC